MDFFSYGAESRIGEENTLLKIKRLIDWDKITPLLYGLYKCEESDLGGQRPYDTLKMLQAIILGQWYSLSDPELENALKLRLDFMFFTDFNIGDDVPDYSTLCRFRNRLTDKGLYDKIFQEINNQLEKLELKVKECEGAIVDATLVSSAARPRRVIEHPAIDREEDTINAPEKESEAEFVVRESADPDSRFLKKGKKYYFGYKGFISVDSHDGYILNTHATPANESELYELEKTIGNTNSKRVYADKGYACKHNRQLLRDKKIKDGIMSKAVRGKPLIKRQKQRNKLISKLRYKVEQTFGTLKRKFEFGRASYFTMGKFKTQLILKAICYNLLKASRKVQEVRTI